MNQFFELAEQNGVFSTVLPPFNASVWREILCAEGFVWISNPGVDLSGKLDTLVANTIAGLSGVDLRCSIQRLELDISIPTTDFLRTVGTNDIFSRYRSGSKSEAPAR